MSSWSMAIVIDTTIEGADLGPAALETDVPIAVQLDSDTFDFSLVAPDGTGIAFVDQQGDGLAYEVERWDSAAAQATIWVRIPEIRGDTTQTVVMRGGDRDLAAGTVFGSEYGDLGVWHFSPRGGMGGTFYDSTAAHNDLVPDGTLLAVVEARGLLAGGVQLGANERLRTDLRIANQQRWSYGIWFRPDAAQNQARLIGQGGEIRLSWGADVTLPDRVKIHVDLEDVNHQSQGYQAVFGSRIMLSEWTYAVANYDQSNRSIELFVNDGTPTVQSWNTNSIRIPSATHSIGGGFSSDDYLGLLDEVRISDRLRSADWILLTYQNQRPMQRLVKLGPVDGVAP